MCHHCGPGDTPSPHLDLFPTPSAVHWEVIASGGHQGALVSEAEGPYGRGRMHCGCRLKGSSRMKVRGDPSNGRSRAPKMRDKKGSAGRGPRAVVPLSPVPSQAFTVRQRPLPVTYQWGLIVHVHHGVLQRRKPKQTA